MPYECVTGLCGAGGSLAAAQLGHVNRGHFGKGEGKVGYEAAFVHCVECC